MLALNEDELALLKQECFVENVWTDAQRAKARMTRKANKKLDPVERRLLAGKVRYKRNTLGYSDKTRISQAVRQRVSPAEGRKIVQRYYTAESKKATPESMAKSAEKFRRKQAMSVRAVKLRNRPN